MPEVAEVTKSIERLLEQIELSTGQKPVPEIKRAYWRYSWTSPATVKCVDPDDSSKPLLVTTNRISADSMSISSRSRLECDCKISITLQTDEGPLQIPATTVHCTESLIGFTVGVIFDLD